MPCLLYSKKPSQNTFFVISADNYFSSIYIYLSSKTSLTKFCKKKNTVTIIPNFKLNTRNKKK